MRRPLISWCGGLFLATLPCQALANVPLVPIGYLMSFSLFAFFRTVGLAFILVVLAEGWMLHYRHPTLSLKASILESVWINLYSTVIGFLIWGGSSSGDALITVGAPISAILVASNLTSLGLSTGVLKNKSILTRLLLTSLIAVIFYFLLGPLSISLGLLTIPGHSYRSDQLNFPDYRAMVIALGSGVALFGLGFILSWISESYLLVRRLASRQAGILLTVFWMNLVSYSLLLVLVSPFIYSIYLERGWFYHR